jgi:hypothetical protein
MTAVKERIPVMRPRSVLIANAARADQPRGALRLSLPVVLQSDYVVIARMDRRPHTRIGPEDAQSGRKDDDIHSAGGAQTGAVKRCGEALLSAIVADSFCRGMRRLAGSRRF